MYSLFYDNTTCTHVLVIVSIIVSCKFKNFCTIIYYILNLVTFVFPSISVGIISYMTVLIHSVVELTQ